MGYIYRRKWKDKNGTVRESLVWWLKYYQNGRSIRESSGTQKETAARKMLKLKEGDVAMGLPALPRIDRVRFEELVEDLLNDYKINGKRSLSDVKRRCDLHLTPYFGGHRVVSVTTADIRKYTAFRKDAGATNGTINRELSALKRSYNLAIQAGKLLTKPHIPMLKEAPPRTGFFDAEQIASVISHLPEPIRPLVKFLSITG